MAQLTREGDGEGYYGARVEAWDRVNAKIVGNKPMVGYCLLVGTVTAGMFSSRDWWRTTEITEILSEDEGKVVFKTVSGSTYIFSR